jgi:hypothetical protein
LDIFLQEIDKFTDEYGNKVLGSWRKVAVDRMACKQLVREYKTGQFGTIKKREGRDFEEDATRKMDATHEHFRGRNIMFRGASGAAGCGKSAPLKAFLKSKVKQFNCKGVWFLSVPRVLIRQDWHDSMQMGRGSYALNTFEQAFTRGARVLIIDELSLLPPGYVDLLCIMKPNISHVILLGDTVQSKFNNPESDTKLNELQNEAARWFGKYQTPYCFWTHRSPQCIANAYGIPCTSPVRGVVERRTILDPNVPIIAATNGEVGVLGQQGNVARNVGGAQGGTCHTAQIIVSSVMLSRQSMGDFYSAVSRVTHKLILVEQFGPGYLALRSQRPDIMAVMGLGPPVNFRAIFNQQLAGFIIQTLPESKRLAILNARKAPKTTHASGMWTERAPPQLAVMIQGEDSAAPREEKPTRAEEPIIRVNTHVPRADPNMVLEEACGELTFREERELIRNEGMTMLFAERPTQFSSATDQLFPQQQGNDPVLFRVTVDKRLEYGTAADNLADLHHSEWKAQLLFEAMARYLDFGAKKAFDAELFQECIFENEFRKLTLKTQAVLLNNVKRSDPDWKLNLVDHFIKSQLKGKLETLGKPGKAGQTLATCQDAVVLLFGPMVRYLRRKVMHEFPPELYCNCEKTNEDLSDWAREHWEDRESTESDFEGFDSTQRGDSLGLELKLMAQFGLHEAWMSLFEQFSFGFLSMPDLYEWWKLNIISTVIGPKQTGRDTGEPGTYDFNTYFNLAVTCFMYNLPRGVPLCIGGDDMSANRRLTLDPTWLRVRHHFLLKAKVEYTTRPSFCGFYLTRRGSFRNPRLLMLKTLWHIDKGDSAAVDMNYATECYSAYRLGDHLIEYCTFLELECQGWLLEYYHQKYPWAQRIFGGQDVREVFVLLKESGPLVQEEDWLREGVGKKARRSMRRVHRFQQALLGAIAKSGESWQ